MWEGICKIGRQFREIVVIVLGDWQLSLQEDLIPRESIFVHTKFILLNTFRLLQKNVLVFVTHVLLSRRAWCGKLFITEKAFSLNPRFPGLNQDILNRRGTTHKDSLTGSLVCLPYYRYEERLTQMHPKWRKTHLNAPKWTIIILCRQAVTTLFTKPSRHVIVCCGLVCSIGYADVVCCFWDFPLWAFVLAEIRFYKRKDTFGKLLLTSRLVNKAKTQERSICDHLYHP